MFQTQFLQCIHPSVYASNSKLTHTPSSYTSPDHSSVATCVTMAEAESDSALVLRSKRQNDKRDEWIAGQGPARAQGDSEVASLAGNVDRPDEGPEDDISPELLEIIDLVNKWASIVRERRSDERNLRNAVNLLERRNDYLNRQNSSFLRENVRLYRMIKEASRTVVPAESDRVSSNVDDIPMAGRDIPDSWRDIKD